MTAQRGDGGRATLAVVLAQHRLITPASGRCNPIQDWLLDRAAAARRDGVR